MKQLMKKIQGILEYYFRITTVVTFVTAVYITIFWGVDCALKISILWQILGVSAFCTLGCLLVPDDGGKEEKISKSGMRLRQTLLFLYVNAVVLISGFLLEWFYLSSWKMILGMEVCIVFVYAAVVTISQFANYRVAEKMNRKLKERENSDYI